MTRDERRIYNREWMQRWRRAKGIQPQSKQSPEEALRKKRVAMIDWQRRNPELVKAARRRYYERHRERLIAKAKALYEGQKETRRDYYLQRREAAIENSKRWQKDNPERVSLTRREGNVRRSERIKATRQSYRISYRRILERDGYWCGICAAMIIGVTLKEIHFDHIVPLSKGGAHTEENIQVTHAQCNLRKHASMPS